MNNNFLNTQTDIPLPDLLYEGPLIDDMFCFEAPPLNVVYPGITELNLKLDNLSLECNTQALQLEVERVKRQELRASIRAMKQQISLPCPDTALIKREIQTTQLNQNAVNYQLDGEMARINTMAFRCFVRIHSLPFFSTLFSPWWALWINTDAKRTD